MSKAIDPDLVIVWPGIASWLCLAESLHETTHDFPKVVRECRRGVAWIGSAGPLGSNIHADSTCRLLLGTAVPVARTGSASSSLIKRDLLGPRFRLDHDDIAFTSVPKIACLSDSPDPAIREILHGSFGVLDEVCNDG